MTPFEAVLKECDAAFLRGDWLDLARGMEVIRRGSASLAEEPDPGVRLTQAVGGLQALYALHVKAGRKELAAEVARLISDIEGRLN